MTHNLMDFVTSIRGPCAAQRYPDRVELIHADDDVIFRGPSSLNVSVEVETHLTPLHEAISNGPRTVAASLYSYDINIPAGFTSRFEMRAWRDTGRLAHGRKLVIRWHPCPPVPCVPPDIPCDFAVRHEPDCGYVFPAGCEPCGNLPVRMPPDCGPTLTVVPARGGCIRPRFFNGMFITREDMETELRYFRVKNQLQRRADGQGVVWGLGLGRDGRAICVHPGYAVDCCGNDLTVTSIYKVEAAALLADPAICHRRSTERECFALLLEYTECPEEPRPVHGDPCAGSATACEMSRVRETVRLRLVPPRHLKPDGPIPKFLRALSEGRGDEECHKRDRHDRDDRECWPCLTDPCCADTPLFPPGIVWALGNPYDPDRPAGPKVIGLAVMYSLLAGSIASENGDEGEDSPKVRAAGKLYRMAARLFDRSLDVDKDELERLTIRVQQLLSDWCCAFLYPGPCCEGEPHGVVIGCAVVCGGEIERIDPWGGRRWVMHYPLLAYWGKQFGIVPPDALASRIFAFICCLARLERPSCEGFYQEDRIAEKTEMEIGGATFGIGSGPPRQSEDTVHGRQISRRETVSLLEFAAHALAAIAQPPVAERAPLREVRLEGNSDVYLLVPDPAAVMPTTVAKPRVPGEDPLTVLVRDALAVPRTRRAHRARPLFRAFHENLSAGLAANAPLSALTPPPPRDLAETLQDAGIETIGALLGRSPEALAGDFAGVANTAAVNDLIVRTEAKVAAITADTVEIVQSVATEYRLLSAVDLSGSDEARGKLIETLAERLQLPAAMVAQVLDALV
jgi:hypothetical protein